MVFDVPARKIYLYSNTQLDYKNLQLKAERTDLDLNRSQLHAIGVEDSTGELVGPPYFKDGADEYHAEEMTYNFRTRRGLIIGARTVQDGNYVLSDRTRKQDDSTYYIKGGQFTTCDHPHPHYYFQSTKMKVIPKDRIITGPFKIVIADVPLPLIIPFGFFPVQKDRASGIILPTYGSRNGVFFFRNLGYYWAASPYFDLTLRGDIYTNTSFRAELQTQYKKLYRFDGTLKLQGSRILSGERYDPGFSEQRDFFVNWTHNQTFSPTARFNGNINAGTGQFLANNTFNINQAVQNVLTSSLTFSKSFTRMGWNLVLGATHRQDLRAKSVTLGFPDINFTPANRFYPFRRRKAVGSPRWYEQVNVAYGMNFRNVLDTYDSLLFTSNSLRRLNMGLSQTVGVSTNFKLFQNINISPSFNYRELWYPQSVSYRYVADDTVRVDSITGQSFIEKRGAVVRDTIPGFAPTRSFDAGISASTAFYGVFQVKRAANGLAFRHTIRPELSYNYTPDFGTPFWGVYQTVQADTFGRTRQFSRFDGSIFGGPGLGERQSIRFQLANVLETKYLPATARGDTVSKKDYKKLTLLENLSGSMSYNMAADSLQWSDLLLNARTNILNVINLNANATYSPYALVKRNPESRNEDYVVVNQFASQRNQGMLRFVRADLATGFSWNSETRKPRNRAGIDTTTHKYSRRASYSRFHIPTQFNINYTLTVQRPVPIRTEVRHFINANATFQLTTFWKLTGQTSFDLETEKFGNTQIIITRDLHCWEFAFTWIPFGTFKSYLFTIGVKAASLRDLKVEKRNQYQDRFVN